MRQAALLRFLWKDSTNYRFSSSSSGSASFLERSNDKGTISHAQVLSSRSLVRSSVGSLGLEPKSDLTCFFLCFLKHLPANCRIFGDMNLHQSITKEFAYIQQESERGEKPTWRRAIELNSSLRVEQLASSRSRRANIGEEIWSDPVLRKQHRTKWKMIMMDVVGWLDHFMCVANDHN